MSALNLKNIKCYGQPQDCRGWRQFLVERYCPNDPLDGKVPLAAGIPCVIWVCDGERNPALSRLRVCGHKSLRVHESSASEIKKPTPRPTVYWVCEKQGSFIE
jgi:hypothetical protein